MTKGEGLAVLEDKMEALDPGKTEFYKFLGCEQGEKMDVKSHGKSEERNTEEIRSPN